MDELNATTGSETPATTDVGTASAPADIAVTQPAETQDQTVPETQAEEFSAGWTFGEEGEPQSAELTDEEIAELTKDPNLDQSKAPALVEKLRTAWANEKQTKAEARQLREQLAQLEQFGGIEGVSQTMSIVSGLIHNPETGTLPFWQAIAKDAQPAYWASVQTLAQHAPEDLIAALQEAGKLPDVQAQAAANQLTADDWARIPKELHDVAKQIPVNQLIEWLDKGTDESLLFNLQTHKELADLKGAQKQNAEREWRTAVQQAEARAQQTINGISDQFEKAHYAQLSKWQPFGPGQENEKQNQQLYKAILEGAHASLLEDKQWQSVYEDAMGKLQNAPLRRLRNEHLAADADERDARGLAARYNARLGQVMKGMIQNLDSVFRDARQWREHQRQSAPDRREIPGISSTAANGHNNGVPALDENGNISEGFMARLTERMKGWRGA